MANEAFDLTEAVPKEINDRLESCFEDDCVPTVRIAGRTCILIPEDHIDVLRQLLTSGNFKSALEQSISSIELPTKGGATLRPSGERPGPPQLLEEEADIIATDIASSLASIKAGRVTYYEDGNRPQPRHEKPDA